MKLNISKDKLLEGLQLAQSVVSTRTTLPILSNVLLKTTERGLRLTTTDLDIALQGDIEAGVLEQGSTTLPAKRLFSVIREFPSALVDIAIDEDNTATLRAGSGIYKIKGLPQDEFPPLPQISEAVEFTLQQSDLANGLKQTSYAMSTDDSRYVLNGVHCVFEEGKLTLVATDGRRLALCEIALDVPVEEEIKIILPAKSVNELQKLLKDTGAVKVSIGRQQASFELNNLLLVTRLIEGRYPNFRQVIPSQAGERIALDREQLLHVVRRVSIMANEESNIVKLHFSEHHLEITAETPDVGEARESVPIAYTGESFTISFNPEFFMAPLKNLPDDEVYFEVIDGMNPGILKVNSGSFLYVIMPLRTQTSVPSPA